MRYKAKRALARASFQRVFWLQLFAIAIFGGCTSKRSESPNKTFSKAEAIGDSMFPSEFKFSTSKYIYSIKGDGQGLRKVNETDTKAFVLVQESQDMLSHLSFLDRGEGVILLFEITNDSLDAGWGEIVEFNQSSLKIYWRKNIPFNVGEPLVEDNYVYLTGIGYIAKLALDSGKVIWQHDNLYDPKSYHFNSFEIPKIAGDTVLFMESPDQVKEAKTVRVHRIAGKILSIK